MGFGVKFRFASARCIYCGDTSGSVDHAIPFSFNSLTNRSRKGRGIRLSSCMECNTLLSNFFFESLYLRCEWIQQRLKDRHTKLLNGPDWDEGELEELTPNDGLKIFVDQQQILREGTRERIDWFNGPEQASLVQAAVEKAIAEEASEFLINFLSLGFKCLVSGSS